jgi:hypothetical protein
LSVIIKPAKNKPALIFRGLFSLNIKAAAVLPRQLREQLRRKATPETEAFLPVSIDIQAFPSAPVPLSGSWGQYSKAAPPGSLWQASGKIAPQKEGNHGLIIERE